MSAEYIVISTDEPVNGMNIDAQPANIEMRFYEKEHAEAYARGQSKQFVGRRFYVLLGASTWYQVDECKHEWENKPEGAFAGLTENSIKCGVER